jgi:hypothetical protein
MVNNKILEQFQTKRKQLNHVGANDFSQFVPKDVRPSPGEALTIFRKTLVPFPF